MYEVFASRVLIFDFFSVLMAKEKQQVAEEFVFLTHVRKQYTLYMWILLAFYATFVTFLYILYAFFLMKILLKEMLV